MDTENKNSKKPASNKKVTRKKVPNKPINKKPIKEKKAKSIIKDLLDIFGEENAARISIVSIDDLPKEIQEQIRANLEENDISEKGIEVGVIKGYLDDKDTELILFNGVLKVFCRPLPYLVGIQRKQAGEQVSVCDRIPGS